MALASFSNRSTPSAEEKKLLNFLLDCPHRELSAYEDVEHSRYCNVGVDDPEFRNFAGIFSDKIFDIFHQIRESEHEERNAANHRGWMWTELRLEHQVEGDRPFSRGLRAASC